MTTKQLQDLMKCKDEIAEKFPEEHDKYLFWCPKDKDSERTQEGYTLYAYGGRVLDLYVSNGSIHFSLFPKEYESYFVLPNHTKTWGNIKDSYEKVKEIKGTDNERLDRLKRVSQEEWHLIFCAFKERAYNLSGLQQHQHLERARETAIAKRNNGNDSSGIKIIEMESRIPDAKKKPDLIGVREETGQIIFSFIEYKCTTGAMDGDHRPIDHFEDMLKYYNNDNGVSYFEEYNRRIGSDYICELKMSEAKKEMLFLFSHIGDERGMTVQKAINGLKTIQSTNHVNLKDVKVVILKDEMQKLDTQKIMTIDEALTYLDEMKKQI